MNAWIVWMIRLLTGINPQWKSGAMPSSSPKSRVYYANHGSHLDFVTLWACLPLKERARTRPVAAKEYWEKGAIRRYLASKVFRALLIDRQIVKHSEHPLTALVNSLQAGECLILFPEGTRNPDGEIREFKSGIYHLFQKCPEVEFVPVYFQNLNRILPKGQFLPLTIIASVVFGTPLTRENTKPKRPFFNALDLRF